MVFTKAVSAPLPEIAAMTMAPMVIGSPLIPGSGAAAGGVRETTPFRRATSEENSRDKKNDFSSSSPAKSLTTISAMMPPT
jgi:hypothetical protein